MAGSSELRGAGGTFGGRSLYAGVLLPGWADAGRNCTHAGIARIKRQPAARPALHGPPKADSGRFADAGNEPRSGGGSSRNRCSGSGVEPKVTFSARFGGKNVP